MFTIKRSLRLNCSFSGFMLIELLIALAIGLVIVSVILEIYLTTMRSYHLQSHLNQAQDNAKITIDILTTEIHRAGYIGCARLTADFPVASYSTYTLTPQNKITSPHANEIVIQHMGLPAAVLLGPVENASILSVSQHVNFKPGHILMIADCKHADIFQVKAVKDVRGTRTIYSTRPLHYHYAQYAEVGQLEINTYFTADTARKYLDGTPVYALYVKNNQGTFELVEGIQRMTVRYAIRNGSRTVELPANEITDWTNVEGVAIDLNVVSPPLKKIWHLYAAVEGHA